MTLKVLVADSRAEDVLFLRDVIAELDGGDYWTTWTHVVPSYAVDWEQAEAILRTDPVDVLLLDLDLDGRRGPELFLKAQKIAPQVPVVFILDRDGLALGERLLREGAQDFLMREDIDCAPLARSLANAVARHRLLAAVRASAMVDPLTGFLTSDVFEVLAERERILAKSLHQRMILILACVGPAETTIQMFNEQNRDLELMAAADNLRDWAGATGLTGRLGGNSLALLAMETADESVEEIRARLRTVSPQQRIEFGAAIFDPDESVSVETLLDRAASNLPTRALVSSVSLS